MTPENCRNFCQKLSPYLDGELTAAEKAAVESHTASCPSCAAELASLRAVSAAVAALPRPEPSPFFAARTAAAARAVPARAPLLRFLRFPVPAAAVLTAFILFNFFALARDIRAMEPGPRGRLAQKVVAQMVNPSTLINPVAVARLCSDCADYLCQCMHEAGRQNICPCKNCSMHRAQKAPDGAVPADSQEEEHVH